MNNNNTKSVTITLTESCNLSCVYCYEHNKKPIQIDVNLAKEIIDSELNDDSADSIFLDFFGGEPFMAFDMIKELVEYVYSKKWPVPVLCSTCTNGTLVHGDIQKWLFQNRERFIVGLSFDGTREMQNYNRCNSFDLVDLFFFKRCWPNQKVKMTISPKTLGTLSAGVIFLHEQGFGVACNLAYGLDWTAESNVAVLKRELMVLIDYYLLHPDIEPCTMLSMKIEYTADKPQRTVRKWCGCSTHMHTYDICGNVYPCQFFMPLSLGAEKAEKAKELDILEDIPVEMLGSKCVSCPFITICPMCIGSNYQESGSLYIRNESFCQYMRTIIYANSYFRWKQIENKAVTPSPDEEYRILKGIKSIQNHLHGCITDSV